MPLIRDWVSGTAAAFLAVMLVSAPAEAASGVDINQDIAIGALVKEGAGLVAIAAGQALSLQVDRGDHDRGSGQRSSGRSGGGDRGSRSSGRSRGDDRGSRSSGRSRGDDRGSRSSGGSRSGGDRGSRSGSGRSGGSRSDDRGDSRSSGQRSSGQRSSGRRGEPGDRGTDGDTRRSGSEERRSSGSSSSDRRGDEHRGDSRGRSSGGSDRRYSSSRSDRDRHYDNRRGGRGDGRYDNRRDSGRYASHGTYYRADRRRYSGYGPRRAHGYWDSRRSVFIYNSGYSPLGWLLVSYGYDFFPYGYVGDCEVVSQTFYRRGRRYEELALLCYDDWGYGYIRPGSRRVYRTW